MIPPQLKRGNQMARQFVDPLLRAKVILWIKENEESVIGKGQGFLFGAINEVFKEDLKESDVPIKADRLANWAKSVKVFVGKPRKPATPKPNLKSSDSLFVSLDIARIDDTLNSLQKQIKCLFAKDSETNDNDFDLDRRLIQEIKRRKKLKKRVKKLRKDLDHYQDFIFVLCNAVEKLFYDTNITPPKKFEEKMKSSIPPEKEQK